MRSGAGWVGSSIYQLVSADITALSILNSRLYRNLHYRRHYSLYKLFPLHGLSRNIEGYCNGIPSSPHPITSPSYFNRLYRIKRLSAGKKPRSQSNLLWLIVNLFHTNFVKLANCSDSQLITFFYIKCLTWDLSKPPGKIVNLRTSTYRSTLSPPTSSYN